MLMEEMHQSDPLGFGSEMRLCHGEVTGQGPTAGKRFWHAWIEIADGQLVVDRSNGKDALLRAERYYEVGCINADEVRRYTLNEMAVKVLQHEHWGPWDE